ncbi:MAG: pyridine nucleotide-disulfide oxidoreductase [Gammaproteobacteria bacterium]|nr:pyridine nucleotide-disulfide oxidoreductase [Gammaproteobacteria bacterium]
MTTPPLLLAGAGHAHLVMFRRWLDSGYRPPPGTALINPDRHAWYSGMMPGLMAGRYGAEQCAIALAPLCRELGIRLIQDVVRSLDAASNTMRLGSGMVLGYQCLSINTGSQPPAPPEDDGSIQVVPAKPFPALHQAWSDWRDQAPPARLGVLGGGAAAIELALAMRASLADTELHVFSASELLAQQPFGLIQRVHEMLAERRISVHTQTRITRIEHCHVMAEMRPICQLDALVLASGAAPLHWYADSGLAQDGQGFLCATETLQSTSHPNVFVSGDSASLPGSKKSGVYSVRHGPVLADNIQSFLQDRPLTRYQPQKKALALLATADGGALTNVGGWTLGGRLIGRWKDWLDQRFMARHRVENAPGDDTDH